MTPLNKPRIFIFIFIIFTIIRSVQLSELPGNSEANNFVATLSIQ